MKIIKDGIAYECASFLKSKDALFLINADGITTDSFSGINDWAGYDFSQVSSDYMAAAASKSTIAKDEKYLSDTDWYATRYAETGVAIPDEVKAARAAARLEISNLRGD